MQQQQQQEKNIKTTMSNPIKLDELILNMKDQPQTINKEMDNWVIYFQVTSRNSTR